VIPRFLTPSFWRAQARRVESMADPANREWDRHRDVCCTAADPCEQVERRVDAAPDEVLRTAATVLRELAAEATPGPWEIEWTYDAQTPQAVFRMHPEHPDDPDLSGALGIMDENPADNAWVATLGPQVAQPLAAWLECAAADALVIGADAQALAVARVILGGDGR
jgi:hypothetical protein